ncbi:hypothetical protein [Methylobacter sp. S3L5C]|uniref:hypothetical protein n=1 Tax=Methylobacter sp. S3L5C TaxID=2839024 RepID=UPI001FAE51E0|nr:hypothetical protein [Methylobacter sp. S3L5C]UOA08590.1 hypothetical protein KKZ03_20765 [Methylobacter sp. S3L5C]
MNEVTEIDFRIPEFRNADPKDYEFRSDGKIVRKDRWEVGIHRVVGALGMDVREFEIDDVIYAVKTIINRMPDNPCLCGCCKIGHAHDSDCRVHESEFSTNSDCDCTLSCCG